MSAAQPHIVIAGGGMVGLSLALLLDVVLPDHIRISLVERFTLPESDDAPRPYHPSFDARSTALSYSSAAVLRDLGLWSALEPGLGPIRSIHVSSRGRYGSSVLSAEESGWEALGWVVENPCLGRSLLAAVRQRERIELHCPSQVTDAAAAQGGVAVTIDDRVVEAELLVIADGAESALRERLGFFTRRKSYGQAALIANIAFEKDHQGVAFERFTRSGPLALLPLPSSTEAPHRMALVWTLPPEDAAMLQSADETEFLGALTEAFGYRLGRPRRVGDRQNYPLTLTEAVEQIRRGVVVLGNAAHALHPVAGQGFNLALRDAAELATALGEAGRAGLGLGDTALLADYSRRRGLDQAQTIAASDSLPAAFMVTDPLFALGRDMALAGMDLVPILRRFFVRQAAGVAALERIHG